MERFSTLMLALAGAFVFAVPATAQELTGTLKKIRDSGRITIGHRDASVPFSYYDDKQQPVGYAIDLCLRIVDAVRAELKMPNLSISYALVTSANRIPLMANGTIDLECGSTTKNVERQKHVGFTNTHFVTANRWVSKKASNVNSLNDLQGKTVVSTSGTTNIRQLTEINAAKNLGINIIPANGHPEAFQMVETGRAVAFVMDDILLYTLIAQSRVPGDYIVSRDALSLPEEYAIMLRRDDPQFQRVVDNAMIQMYKSGAVNRIYERWFLRPVPPKGINLNVTMSTQLRDLVVAHRGETARPIEGASSQEMRGPTDRKATQIAPVSLNYHALIIANNVYLHYPHLTTPVADAMELSRLLQNKYGFVPTRVRLLPNAKRADITREMNRLRSELSSTDSLLIYYAGHGRVDTETERGYWLPVDAENSNESNWVANDDITNYLRGMRARHVLIIADSCYSGTLTRDVRSITRVGGDDEWIKRMSMRRARTALTSGGLEPVQDRGGGKHSVFAKALLDVLRENTRPRDMDSLFQEIKHRVVLNAQQTPAYSEIRFANHDLGDFVLVPR